MDLFHTALGYWFLALIALFVFMVTGYELALWSLRRENRNTDRNTSMNNETQEIDSISSVKR